MRILNSITLLYRVSGKKLLLLIEMLVLVLVVVLVFFSGHSVEKLVT